MSGGVPAQASEIARGRAALRRGAWQSARETFEAALLQDPSPEVHECLATALYWLDHWEQSLEVREQAFRLYRESGDHVAAGRVAIHLAVDCLDFRGWGESCAWLERARRLLDGSTATSELGWLALWEGHFALLLRRDRATARERAAQAEDLARQLDLPELERLATALRGLVLVAEGSVDEGMRCLDEATTAALAGDIDALDAVSATCCFLVHACERVRDYDRVARWAERVRRFSREWGIVPALTVCRTQHAAMLIGQGKWREAEEEIRHATERLQATRPLLAVEGIEQLAELRRRQGRWDESLELFARVEGRSLALLGRALIALDRSESADAADLLDRFLRQTPPDNWTGRATALEALVRARLALDRTTDAENAVAELADLARQVPTPTIRAAALLGEAHLHVAGGSCDAARQRIEDALDLLLRAQAPFEAARSRLDLARCLARLGRPGPARQEARSALETFQLLGAARETVRAEAALGELDQDVPAHNSPDPASGTEAARADVVPPWTAQRTAEPTQPNQQRQAARPSLSPPVGSTPAFDLTHREIEVLRLVAQGMADKDIAEKLFLSPHTVHRHVSNIRTKLSLPSRAAAVAWAAQNGLL